MVIYGIRKKRTMLEIENEVKAFGTGGAHVIVPKSWVGKRVKVTLLVEKNVK